MAIHKTVFYSPDRRLRITADPWGRSFTVERDLVFVAKLSSVQRIEAWLKLNYGLSLADLVED